MTLISLFELDIDQYINNFTDELYDLKYEVQVSFDEHLGNGLIIEGEVEVECEINLVI